MHETQEFQKGNHFLHYNNYNGIYVKHVDAIKSDYYQLANAKKTFSCKRIIGTLSHD